MCSLSEPICVIYGYACAACVVNKAMLCYLISDRYPAQDGDSWHKHENHHTDRSGGISITATYAVRGMRGMQSALWLADPVLMPLIAAAHADPACCGLLLSGSRAAGIHDNESDYDVVWVMDDAAFAARCARGEPLQYNPHPLHHRLDVVFSSVHELAAITARASWELPGYATAVVLYDQDGRLSRQLAAMQTIPIERAQADVLAWFDAYLNAFYRSLNAWRRGNMLGAHLQAAESVMHLVRVLFALERRWPPYHDRLLAHLHVLDEQGWPPNYLASTFLRLMQTGDPTLQQDLERRAEILLRERGFEPDLWDGEIAQVQAWRFPSLVTLNHASDPSGAPAG